MHAKAEKNRRTKRINVQVTAEEMKCFKQHCAKSGCGLSQLLRAATYEKINRDQRATQ